MRVFLLGLAILLLSPAARAAESPRPGYVDPRIQTITYDPDQVVVLYGAPGYQLMLEFGPNERLENVSIGDSLGWQVTPNRRANVLFLKPLDRHAVTNMTIITNQRHYAFDLRVARKGVSPTKLPYIVRFIYPQVALATTVPEPPPTAPRIVNSDYLVAGMIESAPVRVFDDGRLTYFEWAAESSTPAIFSVASDGSESLVNSGVRGGFTVVEQLAPRFILRNGKMVATVTNRAYGSASALAAAVTR